MVIELESSEYKYVSLAVILLARRTVVYNYKSNLETKLKQRLFIEFDSQLRLFGSLVLYKLNLNVFGKIFFRSVVQNKILYR